MHPERIGPYLIEKKIGAGGMGSVFLGKDERTGREAAVKVLPNAMAGEPGFVARFNREIDALKSLSSPYVVELYDSGVDGETYYYAMEYVDGETLTARLRREKRLVWREVIEIGVAICKALKSAHDAGIIHRDLKPSNLMLKSDGTVKLTDFGVAQLFASSKLTVTGGVIGTAEYMSPEQATGKKASKQSDIYSLGAVMYAMLTGRPPFTGETTLDVIHKQKFANFDKPRGYAPEAPIWLEDVICKCLEKKPEDRYPDAYVLSLRLQEIPKKVNLTQEDERTLVLDDAKSSSMTVTAVAGSEAADASVGGVELAGGGTLMRDLMKAQIDVQQAGTSVSRFFDNTWVLVAMLAGVVGVAMWFWPRGEKTEPTIQTEETTSKGRMTLDSLRSGFTRLRPAGSEEERLLRRALAENQLGNAESAMKIANAVLNLASGDESKRDVADTARGLIEFFESGQDQQVAEYVKRGLERAEELQKSGKTDEADQLQASLRELYSGNARVEELLGPIKKGISKDSGGSKGDEKQ